jgi:putative transposase
VTATTRRPHQNKAYWMNLVEQQEHSGLKGAEFCRQENIQYASFMGWRKRLQVLKVQPSSEAPSAFVELSVPVNASQLTRGGIDGDRDLCVELSLGAGIELRITRRT